MWKTLFLFLGLHMSLSAGESIKTTADEEMEQILGNWVSKLFQSAGIHHKPRIILVLDPAPNAAASFGGDLYVFTGLLSSCETVGQLIGVLAHETGHIARRDPIRMTAAFEGAATPAIATTLAGAALAILTQNPGPLVAGMGIGSTIAERGLLKYSRSQEESADAAALVYLSSLGWSPQGLADFLNFLQKRYGSPYDPYLSTHPINSERRHKVTLWIQKNPHTIKPFPPKFEEDFQLIKAKAKAFTEDPKMVVAAYVHSKTIAGFYGLAIAYYRNREREKALGVLDQLIALKPKNPYFKELKGQFLLDMGRALEACKFYKQALALKPQSIYLKLTYAQALLACPEPPAKKIIQLLLPVVQEDSSLVSAWRWLAQAYGLQKNQACVNACLAEEAMLLQRLSEAEARSRKGEQCAELRQSVRDLRQTLQVGR